MFRPDPESRDPFPVSWPVWVPAITAAALIVSIGAMTTWLALRFDALRPTIGDMIVFSPTPTDSDSWQLTVETSSVVGRGADAGPCIFDPNEIAVNGGSLVVEGRIEANPPRFQLHWAGQHTAKGSGDCGTSADLTLDRYDLQRLANAAGGFGVKPRAISAN